MSNLHEILDSGLAELGLNIEKPIKESLIQYLNLMLETNQRLNLTSIRDPEEAVRKHLVDSLSALTLDALEDSGREENWVDLGSGGGLPGIALALARPKVKLVMMESTQKKAAFLDQAVRELGLTPRVRVEAQRSEQLCRGPLKSSADVLTARAVGSLEKLVPMAFPFLKEGGILVAYKGPRIDEELKSARKALSAHKAREIDRRDFTLPGTEDSRSLLVLKRESKF